MGEGSPHTQLNYMVMFVLLFPPLTELWLFSKKNKQKKLKKKQDIP